MARAFYILAGLVLFVMAYVSYVFEIDLLFGLIKSRPFTILAVPFAGLGAIIFVYGLIAGRKIGSTSSQGRKIGGGKTK